MPSFSSLAIHNDNFLFVKIKSVEINFAAPVAPTIDNDGSKVVTTAEECPDLHLDFGIIEEQSCNEDLRR